MLAWPQTWFGALVAVCLTAPNLLWQWSHGWPFFDVIMPFLESQKNYTGMPWEFELRQAYAMNIALAPLWLAGAIAPFHRPKACDLEIPGDRIRARQRVLLF
jgi:hypothetical protein